MMSSSKGAMPIRSRPPHRTMLTELAASGQITPPPSDTDDPAYVASAIEILTASEYGTVADVKTVRFDLGHHDGRLGSLDARVETVAERLSDVANELDAVADETRSSGRSTYSWENKFDHIDVRFAELEEKVDTLQDDVGTLQEEVKTLQESVEARFDRLEARSDKLEARFDRLEARFDRLEARFDRLEATLMNQNRYRLNDFVERGPFTKNGLNRVRDYWSLHRPENHPILVQELEARSIAWEAWAIPEHEDSGDLDPPPSTHLEAVSLYPVPAVMQLFGYLGLQYRKVEKEINRLEARKAKLESQSVLKQRSDMEVDTHTQASSTDSPEQSSTASQ